MVNRRKQKTEKSPALIAVLAVLALAVLAHELFGGLSALGAAGERAAILSAALQMPDSAIVLLRQRVSQRLGSEWDKSDQSPAPSPRPQAPQQQDSQGAAQPDAAPAPDTSHIPDRYAGPLVSQDYSGRDNAAMVPFKNILIKNETVHEDEDVLALLDYPMELRFADTTEPQVLIVHTHATEAFEQYDSTVYDTRNTWRSTDNNINMVALGRAFAQVLEQNGVGVIHDTTQHDYPSYNGSYERSAQTIQGYLEEYPSIKVVLDLHRDAMQQGDAIIKPVAEINGQKASQIMIISACDDGTLGVPNWRENFRFAAALQSQLEASAPGITRPVYLCYRKYNMDLTTGSLLIEFGSNANTLEEGLYSATLAAQALADLIAAYTE